MSKLLKVSGFAGLSLQMVWGMYNTYLIMPGGPDLASWLIGAHAHFGVLGILAVALGFGVEQYDLQGIERSIVEYGYVVGQWALPLTIVVAIGGGIEPLSMLEFLWALFLLAAMLVMLKTVLSEG